MGDPKKLKKKYSTSKHPWKKQEIELYAVLRKEYGLVKRKEILIALSFLKKYKDIAKKLIATKSAQAEKEKRFVLAKLQQLGLLPPGAELDQILGLELKGVLERRIQSLVYRKGLARSMKQARQFITHRHIMVNHCEITIPSYLMTLEEESALNFKSYSALSSEDHPERINVAAEVKKEIELVKGKSEEEITSPKTHFKRGKA